MPRQDAYPPEIDYEAPVSDPDGMERFHWDRCSACGTVNITMDRAWDDPDDFMFGAGPCWRCEELRWSVEDGELPF